MAVSILQQPAANSIQSSDDPLVFVFSSNQTGQPNFSFIVETTYNSQIVSEDQVFPELIGGIAQFDVEQVLRPLLKAQKRGPVGLFNGENLRELSVTVFERYGTPAGLQSLAVTNVCKIMKAATDEETYAPGWLAANYPPGQKWLTNAPEGVMLVGRGNPVYGSILNTDAQCLVEAQYFDLAGAYVTSGTSGVQTGTDKVNVCLDEALMLSHISPATLDQISRVDVYLNQSNRISFQFVDQECTQAVQLNWLNNIGAVDQFIFTHNREREFTSEISEYTKQFGQWQETPSPGNYYTHNALTSGVTHYLKVISAAGSIHTGWINEANQNWLAEIFQSVEVHAVVGSESEKLPVTNTKSTLDQSRFEDLLNFTVNYKKSNFKSITA